MGINEMIYNNRSHIYHKYGDICERNITRTWKSYGIILSAIIGSIGCASIGPIYAYIKYNERTTFAKLKMPFMVEDSGWEFIVNGILQAIAGVYVVLGNACLEGIIVLFVNALNLSTDISKRQYDEFSAKLVVGRVTNAETSLTLLKICHQIQAVDG